LWQLEMVATTSLQSGSFVMACNLFQTIISKQDLYSGMVTMTRGK